jgi:hypothetical protein
MPRSEQRALTIYDRPAIATVTGHSKLSGGERVDTAQSRPARAGVREWSLTAGSLGDLECAAPGGNLERLAERVPSGQTVAETAGAPSSS